MTVHIGSQLTSLAPLEAAFAQLGEMLRERPRGRARYPHRVDLGGGLGVPHGAGQPEPPKPGRIWRDGVPGDRGWDVRLIFEPGRLIVANAGVLLARVVRVKPGARHPFVIVDAAMNDLMRPASTMRGTRSRRSPRRGER